MKMEFSAIKETREPYDDNFLTEHAGQPGDDDTADLFTEVSQRPWYLRALALHALSILK